jgi:Fe-S cluster assembly scaffold protein SufB|tara:strand:+ start:1188 stop:1487 length:300 start_codon:yes stop_codon:yes gene_type:complete
MAKALKFTEEEVQSIQDLRQDVANTFTRLGQLAIEKKRRIDELDVVEQDLLNQHSSLVQKEQELFKGLNDIYGDGNYDPETNTFTPTEEKEEVLEQTEV